MSSFRVKKIWQSNLLLLGANLLGPLSGIILLPLYLQNFSPSEYGILALMRVVSAFTAIVGTLSLNSAMLTFFFDYDKKEQEQYLQQIFSTATLCAILFTSLALLLGPSFFSYLFDSNDIPFFPLILLAILNALAMGLLSIYYVFLKNAIEIPSFVRLAIIWFVISMLCQFFLISMMDVGIMGALLGPLIASSVLLLSLLAQRKLKFTFQLKSKYLKQSILYSLGMMPFLFANWGIIRADRLVAEQYLSLEQVGQYALALNLAFLVALVASAFLDSIRPYFKTQLTKVGTQAKNYLWTYFGVFQLLLLMASFGIYGLSFLLPCISDSPKYAEITSFLPVALLLILIRSNIRFFNEFFYLWKKNKHIGLISIVNLISFLILIYFFGEHNLIDSILRALLLSNGMALLLTILSVFYVVRRQRLSSNQH